MVGPGAGRSQADLILGNLICTGTLPAYSSAPFGCTSFSVAGRRLLTNAAS